MTQCEIIKSYLRANHIGKEGKIAVFKLCGLATSFGFIGSRAQARVDELTRKSHKNYCENIKKEINKFSYVWWENIAKQDKLI